MNDLSVIEKFETLSDKEQSQLSEFNTLLERSAGIGMLHESQWSHIPHHVLSIITEMKTPYNGPVVDIKVIDGEKWIEAKYPFIEKMKMNVNFIPSERFMNRKDIKQFVDFAKTKLGSNMIEEIGCCPGEVTSLVVYVKSDTPDEQIADIARCVPDGVPFEFFLMDDD